MENTKYGNVAGYIKRTQTETHVKVFFVKID